MLVVKNDKNWIHYVLSPIKQIILDGSIFGNLALWFLPSLLAVQVIYANISRKISDVCIMIFALITAYALFLVDFHQPLYVGNILLGITAYSFGHFMRIFQYKFSVRVISIAIYLAIIALVPSKIDVHLNNCDRGYYLLAIAFSLSGCVVINNIFRQMPIRFRFLEWIGKRSMNFYVMHWLPIYLCSVIFPFSGLAKFAFIVMVCVVVLPCMDRIYAKFGNKLFC